MNGAKKIIEQLAQKALGETGEVLATEANLRVRLNLADRDRLGCLLEKLEIRRTNDRSLSLDPVRVEQGITYLGERLRILENDETGGTVILRSSPPRQEKGRISFFEMVLDNSQGLSLVRLAYDLASGQRITLPAPLSRATLERLLTDLYQLIPTA